jgi:hypothetical protein
MDTPEDDETERFLLEQEKAWRENQQRVPNAAKVVRVKPKIEGQVKKVVEEGGNEEKKKKSLFSQQRANMPKEKKESVFKSDLVVEKSNFNSHVEEPKFVISPFPSILHRSEMNFSLSSNTTNVMNQIQNQPTSGNKNLPNSEHLSDSVSNKLDTNEGIHQFMSEVDKQNAAYMNEIPLEEMMQEQQRLLQTLDPAVVAYLRNRSKKKESESEPSVLENKKDLPINSTSVKPASNPSNIPSMNDIAKKLGRLPTQHETDSMEWMKPVSNKGKESKSKIALNVVERIKQYRFDLSGHMLSEEQSLSIPSNQGLHHHGEDPELAGYTIDEILHLLHSTVDGQVILCLKILNGIFLNAKAHDHSIDASIIVTYLLENRIMIVLRHLLDRTRPTIYLAVIECIHTIIIDSATTIIAKLAASPNAHRGYEVFPLANLLKKVELDEEQREEAEDHDLIQLDLVLGLLQTGFLARIRYLLEEAIIHTHAFMVLDIIWRCLIHSHDAARLVITCPLLVPFIFHTFIAFTPHAEKHQFYPYYSAQPQAVCILRYMCASDYGSAKKILSNGNFDFLKSFLVPLNDDRKYTEIEYELCLETLLLLHVLWRYGLATQLFLDFFPLFSQFMPKILLLTSEYDGLSAYKFRLGTTLFELLDSLVSQTLSPQAETDEEIDGEKYSTSVYWGDLTPFVEQAGHMVVLLTKNSQYQDEVRQLLASLMQFLANYFQGTISISKAELNVLTLFLQAEPTLQVLAELNEVTVDKNTQTSFLLQEGLIGLPNHASFSFNIHSSTTSFFNHLLGSSYKSFSVKSVRRLLTNHTFSLSFLKLRKSIEKFEEVQEGFDEKAYQLWFSPFNTFLLNFKNSIKIGSEFNASQMIQSKSIHNTPLAALYLFRSTIHLIAESVIYFSGRCMDGWREDKSLFQNLCDVLEIDLSLVSCLLPGDEVICIQLLRDLLEVQKIVFTNSSFYPFPLDYFTSTTILLQGLNISQTLTQSLPRNIKGDDLLNYPLYLPSSIDSHLPLPYDWMFLLFHNQGDGTPTLEHVQHGLSLFFDLESIDSRYCNSVPVSYKMAHLMHIYFLSADIYLHPMVSKFVSKLVSLLGSKTKNIAGSLIIDIGVVLGGELYQFTQNFLTVFMSESYGNISQGRFLQFLIQNSVPKQIKKLVLGSITHLWHLLSNQTADASFLCIPVRHFLGEEADIEIIEEIMGCFNNKFLVSSFDELRKNSFIYWYLVHHVAAFIWEDKESNVFNRKQFITQLLEIPQKGILSDIFYYEHTQNVDDDEINFIKNTIQLVSNRSLKESILAFRKQLLLDAAKNQERVDAFIKM